MAPNFKLKQKKREKKTKMRTNACLLIQGSYVIWIANKIFQERWMSKSFA